MGDIKVFTYNPMRLQDLIRRTQTIFHQSTSSDFKITFADLVREEWTLTNISSLITGCMDTSNTESASSRKWDFDILKHQRWTPSAGRDKDMNTRRTKNKAEQRLWLWALLVFFCLLVCLFVCLLVCCCWWWQTYLQLKEVSRGCDRLLLYFPTNKGMHKETTTVQMIRHWTCWS